MLWRMLLRFRDGGRMNCWISGESGEISCISKTRQPCTTVRTRGRESDFSMGKKAQKRMRARCRTWRRALTREKSHRPHIVSGQQTSARKPKSFGVEC
eukprot:2048125-Rhodomonas_salina.1